MRTCLTFLFLTVLMSIAWAQDPGMQAAQMAAQQAQMAAQQMAMQQAQIANQNAQSAMQNAQSTGYQCGCCFATTPRISVPSGNYAHPLTVKIKDSTRGAVIYYTTDGWTPTEQSTRYMGPITIDAATALQAIAVSPRGGRSRVASSVYEFTGAAVASSAGQEQTSNSPEAGTAANSSAAAGRAASNLSASNRATPANDKLLLARGTVVPLMFTSSVSSKTAEVGDKVPLTLAADLKVGNTIVIKKGTPSTAIITQVDKTGVGGAPGELFFQADLLQFGDTVIKLRGGAAKEGQDKVAKSIGLMFVPVVPVGILVHGKDAEIAQGAVFTAYVDADALLPASD